MALADWLLSSQLDNENFLSLIRPDKSVSSTLGSLRACLHEGGGPQKGEVTRLGGVKK